MADINPAKAGDKISNEARKVLAKFAYRLRGALVDLDELENIPKIVEPKAPGDKGQWFCIDCGSLPPHNLGAWGHQGTNPKHRFAWRNSENGKIEEP